MILAATFLILDMFGLQVSRISDVTQDGIDELVVTDPMGDRTKEREGRVLIVDPMNWSLVTEISALADEGAVGRVVSVARNGPRSFIALSSSVKAGARQRISLLEAPRFDRIWSDDGLDRDRRINGWGINMVCVIEKGLPSVFSLEASRHESLELTHFRLWRRTLEGRSIACELDGVPPTPGGRTLLPHFDALGELDGCFVSSIRGHDSADKGWQFEGPSQVHWLDVGERSLRALSPEPGPNSATGLVMLPSSPQHGSFAAEAVAVCRPSPEVGNLLNLFRNRPLTSLAFPKADQEVYWGCSMCWIRDVDGDEHADLAIGSPEKFGGVVQIVGSKTGTVITVVKPPPDEKGPGLPENWSYAPNFGTQVCALPDQDGDGQEDLVVGATTHGGACCYPAALSVVSTKSWKILRVVFERDLIRRTSPK